MKTYADFEIWIGALADNGWPVQVFSSPAGPGAGKLDLNIEDEQFKSRLEQVRSIDPNLALRKSFGKLLFDAVMKDSVRDAWMTSRGRVAAKEYDGLRMRLWINAPELARLPWELICEDDFLATASDIAVSRYLPVPEPAVFAARKPLRVLFITQSPQGFPEIKKDEIDRLEAKMNSLAGSVECKLLRNATRAEIQNELQKDYHALHFLGHGTAGKLMMVDDDHQTRLGLDDAQFSQLFQGRRSLRLVVLNACNSAQMDAGGLFSGIGPALIQKRIPAVIAMQYPFVQLDTASLFSQRFYASLANGLPVDAAVNEARQLISAGELLSDRDWSTPVLYLGTRNGQVMNLLTEEAGEMEKAWHQVQSAAQQDAAATAALDELTASFKELFQHHKQIRGLLELREALREVREDFAALYDPVRAQISFQQFEDVSQKWNALQEMSLIALEVLIDNLPQADRPVWFQPMKTAAAAITQSVEDQALVLLSKNLKSFAGALAQAESRVRLEFNRSVTDLIDLSSRTLGRLVKGEG
jgi:hypothetical protein